MPLNEAVQRHDARGEISAAEFAALMAPLGPFESQPLLAVAVSGGADSLATALLVRDWARERGGDVLALVVDHGLRTLSAQEARTTCETLAAAGIAAVLLPLTGLSRGPALSERARAARHAVLERACAERGILHLVFGHHAADQAETIAMRLLARSQPAGLAGMAALVETPNIRRLRPLLATPPARLRATLRAAGVPWIEDPSNSNLAFLRARLRLRQPSALATEALLHSAAARGQIRATAECQDAKALAAHTRISGLGFALLSASLPATAFAALLGLIAGTSRPPSASRVAQRAAAPSASTMAGVRIQPAGRMGEGWLLTREPAAMQPDIPAVPGAVWDGRFHFVNQSPATLGTTLGAWGSDAPRDRNGLPTAILCTLPALRREGRVIAAGAELLEGPDAALRYTPQTAMTGAGFLAVLPIM